MKRVITVLLILACLPLTAFAEPDYKALLDDINVFADIYKAPQFDITTASITQTDSNGYKWTATIQTTNKAADIMLASKDGENISSILCVCKDESNMIDFLGCCCSIVSYYRDSFDVIDSFGYILFDLMMSRSGSEGNWLIADDGTGCKLSRQDTGYLFTLVFPS